jgi:hypothetical protein
MAPLTTLSLFSAHKTSSCMKEEEEERENFSKNFLKYWDFNSL